jgi:hypothetical protein
MKKNRKVLSGLSFKLDKLFFRNLTLLLSAILMWTGVEHILSEYFIKYSVFRNSVIVIIVGIILLFVFDSEIEEENGTKKRISEKWF